MKILVIGAGGIGGYYGGRLVQAGADVTFLVRERRQQLLQKNGLQIKSALGDFSSQVKTILKDDIAKSEWDVIIVACKAYDLPGVIDTIKPAVGPKTAVLPLLNGLQHIDQLNEIFGSDRVLGGLAKILTMVDSEGIIHHGNKWCFITFGEQDGTMSDRVKQLQSSFPKDTVEASAVPNIRQKMWEKLVHLATTAGMASLMRASIGEIASVPGGSDLMIKFFESNAEIAGKEGCPIPDSIISEYHTLFHDKNLNYIPSLLRDIFRHNQTEGEHILGYMLKLARKHDVDTTLYEIINIGLNAYELRRTTGQLDTK